MAPNSVARNTAEGSRISRPVSQIELDVALRLPLQTAARLDPVEVAVEVDLEQRRWMVGGPAGDLRMHAIEAGLGQIKFIDEDVNRPNWVVFRNVVVKALGE